MKKQTLLALCMGVMAGALAAVTPNQLLFTADEGGPDPAAQTFTINNPYNETVTWHLGDANSLPVAMPSWLVLSDTSGSLDPNGMPNSTHTVTVSIDTAGLDSGHNSAAFRVWIVGTNSVSHSVRIDLNVIGPRLFVSASQISVTHYIDMPESEPGILTVRNAGHGTLRWSLVDANDLPLSTPDWLSISPASGNLAAGQSQAITLTYHTAVMPAGQYSYAFKVADPEAENSPQTVTVSLAVIGPKLKVSTKNIAFIAYELGLDPSAQPLKVTNGGGGVLNWSIDTSSLPTWLSLSPTSGSLDPNETESVILTPVSTGLPVGPYSCQFVVGDTQAGLSETIGVSLNVTGPELTVSKTDYIFSANGSGNPASQTLTVTNTGGGVLNWAIDLGGKPDWLSVSSAGGSLVRNQSSAVTLSVNTGGLVPDAYMCSLDLSDTNVTGESFTVNVHLSFNYDWSTNPGDGSQANPYQISMPFQLASIGKMSDVRNKSFTLTADLDMGMFTGTQFPSIGSYGGTFDGDGYVISNLTCAGVFNVTDTTAVIKNLHLHNVSISGVGILGGLIRENYGTVENCSVTGSVSGSDWIVGGLIGRNYGPVSHCEVNGSVLSLYQSTSTASAVGGLIGHNVSIRVQFCRAGGSVTGYASNAGGLIGRNDRGEVEFCRFDGEVTSTNFLATGGLIGMNTQDKIGLSRDTVGQIRDCYATGTVTGGDRVGGLVGYNRDQRIRSSHSACQVNGTYYVGGLVGYCEYGIVIYSSATGNVTGQQYVGGLIGQALSGSILNSFAENSVSGVTRVGGLVGDIAYGKMANCYCKGTVAASQSNSGGLAGGASGANVSNSYAVGLLSGIPSSTGGLFGTNTSATVTNCFWDTEVSGLSSGAGSGSTAGMVGLTTIEMQSETPFASAGWDYSDEDSTPIHWRSEPDNYPVLNWQVPQSSSSYSAGSGTPDDPYQIADAADFAQLAAAPHDWSKHFVMAADLDLGTMPFDDSPIAPDQGQLFASFQGVPFSGSFDGNGFAIRHLTIEAAQKDYVGLFGYVKGGQVRNLQIEDAVIYGRSHVGTVAGYNCYGTIDHCRTTGHVSGLQYAGGLAGTNMRGTLTSSSAECVVEATSLAGGVAGQNASGFIRQCAAANSVNLSGISTYKFAGGLVGWNSSGKIEQSFSAADVVADGNDIAAGGIAGFVNSGEIASVYSTGSVTSQTASSNYSGGSIGYMSDGSVKYSYSTGAVDAGGQSGQIGGFIGEADSTVHFINSCFWDIRSSGLTYSAAGKAVDTQLIKSRSLFQNAGWAGQGWVIEDGLDSPRLAWEDTAGTPIPAPTAFLAGTGTTADPYCVYTAQEFAALSWHADLLNKNIKLMNDLDLANVPLFPIGDLGPFTGTFDGDGHTLSNVTIHQPGSDCIGLFAEIGMQGRVSGVRLISEDILGNDYVGGIAGKTYKGTINRCYTEGCVEATGYYAGGLAGLTQLAREYSITSYTIRSASACDVSAIEYVGGLVGYTLYDYYCTSDCYATGNVSGLDNVGGLIGFNGGVPLNCYAAGQVIGSGDFVGALIGNNRDSYVTGCFWDTEVGGPVGIGFGTATGATGKTTAQMMAQTTFTAANWDFSSTDGDMAEWVMRREGEDYPRLAWQPVFAGDIAGLYGVDAVDLMEVADHWLQACAGDCEQADIDGSGTVNLADLAIMAADWMK